MAKKAIKKDGSESKRGENLKSRRQKKYLEETRNEDGTIKIPPEVIDKKSWLMYIELHDKVQADPDYIYQTSDPDLKVNVLNRTYALEKLIRHLPQQEKEKIFQVQSRLRGIQSQAAVHKKKALGHNYWKVGSVDNKTDSRIQNKRFYNDRG